MHWAVVSQYQLSVVLSGLSNLRVVPDPLGCGTMWEQAQQHAMPL